MMKNNLVIQEKKVDNLIPYVNNSRTHNVNQVNQIASSIKEFGFTNPILIDTDNSIIAGHGRLLAAKKLGLTQVPTITLEHLTNAQKKAYVIADNKLALNAGWDTELLNLEIKELQNLDFNIDLLGFSAEELNELNPLSIEGLTDEDEVPETPEQAITKLGDVYQLGNHRLMCGDSTNIDNLDKLLGKTKIDMVFTDPPYGLNYSGGRTQIVKKKEYGKLLNDNLSEDELGGLIQFVFSHTKAEADVYICVSPLYQKPFLDAIHNLKKKVDAIIVWDKKNAGLGYMKYRRQCEFIIYIKGGDFKKGDKSDFDLWSISKDNTKTYKHGTQKPVSLVERAILNSSKAEDTILDIFGGSGSTMLACEKTGRDCFVMELDPKFCDVIVKRWEDFTGKKGELL